MSKPVFPSEEWVKALEYELNHNEGYNEAGKNWEGDFYFVVEPDKDSALKEPVYMYMDLWHGTCREAFIVTDKEAKKPAFIMSGTYSKWKRVVTKQLDPIQGLMTGQLKLKGNMVMVMKNVKAAQEMVNACTRIDAEFLS